MIKLVYRRVDVLRLIIIEQSKNKTMVIGENSIIFALT